LQITNGRLKMQDLENDGPGDIEVCKQRHCRQLCTTINSARPVTSEKTMSATVTTVFSKQTSSSLHQPLLAMPSSPQSLSVICAKFTSVAPPSTRWNCSCGTWAYFLYPQSSLCPV